MHLTSLKRSGKGEKEKNFDRPAYCRVKARWLCWIVRLT